MNRILIYSIAFAMCGPACAAASEPVIGGTYLLDVRTGRATPVVTVSLGDIRRPLGLNFNLKVSTFAGLIDEKPLAGFWLSANLRLADNLFVDFGPAIQYHNERLHTPGVAVGLSLRF